jgi:hypothetical protein
MLPKKIYQVPIVGDIFAFLFLIFYYCGWRITAPLTLRLSGLHPVKCGTSVIWVPEDKKQIAAESLELLRSCDSEMYGSLAKKKRFLIFYIGVTDKKVFGPNGKVFGIHEKYFKLGPQGIVMFLVQELILSNTYPRLHILKWKPERSSLRKVLNWMQHHSFHPTVIKSYLAVVEKWEQTH